MGRAPSPANSRCMDPISRQGSFDCAENSRGELSAQSKDPYLLIGSMHLELAGEGARPTRTY